MRGIALRRIGPVLGIQAEEQGDVAHCVSFRTEHIPEEEITELDWVERGDDKAPERDDQPFSRVGVEEVWDWSEEEDDGELLVESAWRGCQAGTVEVAYTNQHNRPVDIHRLSTDLVEVEPHANTQYACEN